MKDEVLQNGDWEFNKEVTDVFPDMLLRSIPGLTNMREMTARITKDWVEGQHVVDIGCSDGQFEEYLFKCGIFPDKLWMVDRSPEMIQKCKEKFTGEMRSEVHIQLADIPSEEFGPSFAVETIFSILTLQFLPMEEKLEVLTRISRRLVSGGHFIIVEKLLLPNWELQRDFNNAYYKMKLDHGYTTKQIFAKRKSLQRALIPVTEEALVKMLKEVGFKDIQCYWRNFQFAGFIATKG